jgi:hypothetical protein
VTRSQWLSRRSCGMNELRERQYGDGTESKDSKGDDEVNGDPIGNEIDGDLAQGKGQLAQAHLTTILRWDGVNEAKELENEGFRSVHGRRDGDVAGPDEIDRGTEKLVSNFTSEPGVGCDVDDRTHGIIRNAVSATRGGNAEVAGGEIIHHNLRGFREATTREAGVKSTRCIRVSQKRIPGRHCLRRNGNLDNEDDQNLYDGQEQ